MARRMAVKPAMDPCGPDSIALAQAYWRDGRPALAAEALVPLLEARGDAGDPAAALAASLLRHDIHLLPAAEPGMPLPIAEELLTQTMERLVALVRRQDAQIAALITAAE